MRLPRFPDMPKGSHLGWKIAYGTAIVVLVVGAIDARIPHSHPLPALGLCLVGLVGVIAIPLLARRRARRSV